LSSRKKSNSNNDLNQLNTANEEISSDLKASKMEEIVDANNLSDSTTANSQNKDYLLSITMPNAFFDILASTDSFSASSSDIDFSTPKKQIKLVYNSDFIKYEKIDENNFIIETNISTLNYVSISEKTQLTRKENLFEITSDSNLKLSYKNGILELNTFTAAPEEVLLNDNNSLIISEAENQVLLPYKASTVLELFEKGNYDSLEDIIAEKYTLSNEQYSNTIKARFSEAFKLMREKEKKSFFSAVSLGLELMFNFSLNPAIITACNNLRELNIYLDFLEENEADKFPLFKVIYKVSPALEQSKHFINHNT